MTDEQTFPRTQNLQLGYSVLEDRVWLYLVLTQGQGAVVAWLPRRMVVGLAERLGELLRHSHPATEGEPAADAVLALEHRAARSALAGRSREEGNEGVTPVADNADPDEPAVWLVSEARVERREDHVIVGLLGQSMPTVTNNDDEAMPVAGLTLTREQTHEVLRLFVEQIDQSDWVLPKWLEWLRQRSME
mgnify:CR=1 FL=1